MTFFKQRLPAGTEIVAVGNSYGSYISARLSAERELAGLSLRVPANYADENFDKPKWIMSGDSDPELNAWREQVIGPAENKALKAVHDFKGAIQIIEAEKDELVPSQTVQNYVHAVADESKLDYHLMEGWPHSLGDSEERQRQFRDILLNWLEQKV